MSRLLWTFCQGSEILYPGKSMNVFISHSQSDVKLARLIREALVAERYKVWIGENEIAPGANWHLEIGKALQRSDAMVVLLSPSAMKSVFVRSDIEHALTSLRFQNRLVPVLAKPTADIPWVLKQLSFIDATRDKEKAVRDVAAALRVASTLPANVRWKRVHAQEATHS